MIPLQVTARIRGEIILPARGIALDGLLGAVVAREQGMPPAEFAEVLEGVEIPVQREPGGRFYLCSFSRQLVDYSISPRVHKIVKRPILQYKMRFNCRGTLDDSKGADKAYHFPIGEAVHLVDDQLDWWCVGDRDEIRRLLEHVTHIGKKRAHGFGEVVRWTVEPCETWEGFPVVKDGEPLRTLPVDWAGTSKDARAGYAVLSPPYWDFVKEELCLLPSTF